MPQKTLKEESLGQTRLRLVQLEDGKYGGRYDRQSGSNVLYSDPGETEQEFWQRLTMTALRDDPSFFWLRRSHLQIPGHLSRWIRGCGLLRARA